MTDAVKIEGLSQFRRSLRDIDRELPKTLRLAFNKAAEIVVDDAQPGVPTRSGRAKATVRARSTQTRARVMGGNRRAPYYPWLDFGGRTGRSGARRPYLPKGRYIYNAYFKNRDSGRFTEVLSEGLVDVAKQAGLEVT